MVEFISAHKEQLLMAWAIIATILFHLSEYLGMSEKYKASSVFAFLMDLMKKSKLEKKPE